MKGSYKRKDLAKADLTIITVTQLWASPPASLEPQTQTPVAAGLESPVVSTHTAHAPWGLYPIRIAPLQPPFQNQHWASFSRP